MCVRNEGNKKKEERSILADMGNSTKERNPGKIMPEFNCRNHGRKNKSRGKGG
tara:strand:- start:240 stop:398 length:159 start_codon:yes stop_codon:yes gene_type:complete